MTTVKLSAVILARALAFAETFDLDPRGSTFYPNLVPQLIERYRFQKFPKSFEELDDTKGIEFHEGIIGTKVIQKFTIFNSLLALETRSNTTDSKAIIEDMLDWGKERFGLRPLAEVIHHWGFVSTVTFTSDFDILATLPLVRLAQKTGEALAETWREGIEYKPLFTAAGHDPLTRKNPIAAFTIQRRAETPFAENKYFSEAPLPTDLHIKFLEEYEADMRQLGNA